MRITKTKKDAERFNYDKMVANFGCDRCPCCGETKSYMEYFKDVPCNKGIYSGEEDVLYASTDGLQKQRFVNADDWIKLGYSESEAARLQELSKIYIRS